MNFLYCGLLGYLIGSINPAYILGKRRGVDIREKGSGNAGASNALLLLGKMTGVFCALFDIVKAILALSITTELFPEFAHTFPVTATAVLFGHIFPFYMRFRGGKGFASLAGIILSFDVWIFLLILVYEVIVVLITNYICFIPMTASIVFSFLYGFITEDVIGAVILGIAALVICIRHIENIQRILKGRELRIRYLWSPNEELDRLEANSENPNERQERLSW